MFRGVGVARERVFGGIFFVIYIWIRFMEGSEVVLVLGSSFWFVCYLMGLGGSGDVDKWMDWRVESRGFVGLVMGGDDFGG